ncbi:IMPACT family protein [Coralloluteibacterium thermophilus]|uniref:IMPACT family protein n=1 Tax=Coralloluteibacterium thermophilum TaxID=2707049 RepID=A0ABV9NPD0_9GAMM
MSRETLAAPAEHAVEIRKSRFLARAAPVASPGEAAAFVEAVADPGATHNCWAWRIGGQYRSSDDGEPAGTAGRPILAAIDGQDCDRVAVVVTRWYGGVKLGAGGLVRAYGGCAAECLRRADRLPLLDTVALRLDCAYPELATLRARLGEQAAAVEDEAFGAERVVLHVRALAERVETLRALHRDLTRGSGAFVLLDPASDRA